MTEAQGTNDGSSPPLDARAHKGQRKLRNLLLDRLQLRYTALIVLVSALLTIGLGMLVYRYARDATDTVKVTLVGLLEDPQAEAQVLSSFAESDRKLLFILIGFGLLLVGVLTLYGIAVTHKVAGPLYKISAYFQMMKDGRLGSIDALRRGDQLQDFFESFRSMHQAMRVRTEEEVRQIDGIIVALEKSTDRPGVDTQLETLRTLKKAKEESLL